MNDKTPPFRATIELDIWVWERPRAAAVLEELIAKIEGLTTNDRGGITIHHRVRSVALEAQADA